MKRHDQIAEQLDWLKGEGLIQRWYELEGKSSGVRWWVIDHHENFVDMTTREVEAWLAGAFAYRSMLDHAHYAPLPWAEPQEATK